MQNTNIIIANYYQKNNILNVILFKLFSQKMLLTPNRCDIRESHPKSFYKL